MNTKFKTVDEYIATFPEKIQQLLEQIRSTIREAAPDATEKISYGMPTFAQEGNLLHFGAWKNHIGIYPASSGIEAFRDRLAEYDVEKGNIKFPLNQPLPLDLIADITKFCVERNLQKAREKILKMKK